MRCTTLRLVLFVAVGWVPAGLQEVPVTIKELDVPAMIQEFKKFEQRLERYREEVTQGQKVAADLAGMLDELRRGAPQESGVKEETILKAIRGYVDQVIGKQIELIDFLESQRFRISYYANRMAASVRPEEIEQLFGTEAGNLAQLRHWTGRVEETAAAVARFIDSLGPDEFDRQAFRPLPGLSAAKERELARLQLQYQNAKTARAIAESRLRLVREAKRAAEAGAARKVEMNLDLLLGQMFGALDRIRLQLSRDLYYLETLLSRYEQSARTQEIFRALEQLVALQGGMEGPSRGLANVLDWLQEISAQKLTGGVAGLDRRAGGVFIRRSTDILREAYRRGVATKKGKP